MLVNLYDTSLKNSNITFLINLLHFTPMLVFEKNCIVVNVFEIFFGSQYSLYLKKRRRYFESISLDVYS
jgi:hypothetical protein